MAQTPASMLRALERCRADFGGGCGAGKLELLRGLGRAELPRAASVLRLHETLCFLRAYPDDARVLAAVERLLSGFERRRDLRRHRSLLADSGIAGTDISYRFFWPTASWLARRWGERLSIDWRNFDGAPRLEGRLHLLALYGETPGLDEFAFPVRQWIERMKGRDETDAVFLVRRIGALRLPAEVRETLYDEIDVPMRIAAGPATPARTRALHPRLPLVYQTRPLIRSRPTFPQDIHRPPAGIRPVSRREGQRIIDLAREAMVTRSRDLDAFAYGDPDDVRLVDCGDGLVFACIGQLPARRLLLETVYGFLTFKNRVPIGYVLSSALFGSSEVAYNVFDTYRGGEAGYVYGRVLAMVRALFGSDTFTIYPYQLGQHNAEGLRSGAWWFYQKLGFRARDPGVLRLMHSELGRLRADPDERSSIATLKKLVEENVYLHLGRRRDDVIGLLPLANVGLQVTRFLAERYGARRERAGHECARQAAAILGVRSFGNFTPGERLAWERWSPLVMILPGLARWSPGERRALAEVVRAKGGRRESDFVALFDRHRRLRRAVRLLAERDTD